MSLYEDVTGRMSISDILRADVQAKFQPSRQPLPYYGFTSSAIWARLEVQCAEEASPWFVEIEEPLLHQVEFYGPILSGVGANSHTAAGRLLPFSAREIQHRKILFPVEFTKEPRQFFVRITSKDNVVVPIKLWPRRDFFMFELGEQLRGGLFYGIILALVLYNFFLFLSIRDINYLYYILYAASFGIFRLAVDGNFFQLFPHSPAWLNWRLPLFAGLSTGTWLLLFTWNFLFLREAPVLLRRSLQILFAGIFVFFILSWSDSSMLFATRHANTLSAVMMVYAISAAVYRTAKGYRPARLFLAGWITLLSGILGASLVNLGFFPPNALTKYWTQTGFLAELLLFSFALAVRIKLVRAEKEAADRKALEAADRKALEAEQRAGARLETLVIERTKELTLANATKDRFFAIIAHDLRGPIGTLSALFTDAIGEDGHINQSLLKAVRTTTKNSYHLLEDLLTWARSQRGEIEFHPSPFVVNDAIKTTVSLLEVHAQRKEIDLSVEPGEPRIVFADQSMASLVIRNLTNNAIKFTAKGGRVSVSVGSRGNQVEVSVRDTGVGIPQERLITLFRIDSKTPSTPGTNLEPGSGLGLILCREFAERNGGEIGVESEKGIGSRFWFTLPAG